MADPSCTCDCSAHWTRDSVTRARKNLFIVCNCRKDLYIFIDTLLRTFYNTNDQSFSYTVSGGQNVCASAFEAFWNITKYCRLHVEASIRDGTDLNVPHGNSLRDYENWKTILVTQWLQALVDVSEHQPDTIEVHTIECALKRDLYEGWYKIGSSNFL